MLKCIPAQTWYTPTTKSSLNLCTTASIRATRDDAITTNRTLDWLADGIPICFDVHTVADPHGQWWRWSTGTRVLSRANQIVTSRLTGVPSMTSDGGQNGKLALYKSLCGLTHKAPSWLVLSGTGAETNQVAPHSIPRPPLFP